MYQTFFIHSSVDGHLGSFHVLAIVNSAAMNNGIHVSFSTLVFSGICLGVGLLGHMLVLFLYFEGIAIMSSIVTVSVYITRSYHLTPVRVAIIKKLTDNKCWRWCGEKGMLLHCW